jgi:hypothetical protein
MSSGAAYSKRLAAIAKTIVAESDVPLEPLEFATPVAKAPKAPRKAAAKPKTKPVAKKGREGAASARKLTALARASEAVRLKRDGYTFHEIGEHLGITRQAAHLLVTKYRTEARELVIEETLDLVLFELERLDFLLLKLRPGIDLGDPKSINTARQIVMDRAKLQGLVTDKQEVEANVVSGVFALPLAPVSPGDWSAAALAQTEGEEERAERIMSGTEDASD